MGAAGIDLVLAGRGELSGGAGTGSQTGEIQADGVGSEGDGREGNRSKRDDRHRQDAVDARVFQAAAAGCVEADGAIDAVSGLSRFDRRDHAGGVHHCTCGFEGMVGVRRTFVDPSDSETEGFELQAIDAEPHDPPLELPGSPILLAAQADDVFTPPGRVMPLVPHHRQFLPPGEPGDSHVWLGNSDGSHDYVRLRNNGTAAEPLITFVGLDDIRTDRRSLRSAEVKQKVPLALRRVYGRRRLERAGGVIYRLETRAGEFGPALLWLLDHAEAGIEKFKYYSVPRGDGPNAIVDHFLRAEASAAAEDQWPQLRRYDFREASPNWIRRSFCRRTSSFCQTLKTFPAW